MNYVELSVEDVKEKSKKLYEKIKQSFDYDLVIFVAKGAFLIGKELSVLNSTDLLEIRAFRKGNKLKKVLKPVIGLLPKKMLLLLRKKEMKSGIHQTAKERNIEYDKLKFSDYKSRKRILLVDDSIDSGNTILQVFEKLKKEFPKSAIKIAVFNIMSKSNFKPDFCLYEDTIINGPWSSDSQDNDLHNHLYEMWKIQQKSFNSTEKVSVAMATYNGEKFIEKQIVSILNALDENDELIISDDGSTDKTVSIIKKLKIKDKRIVLIDGPHNGIIKNFENAITNCKNEFIFLSDQDDVWNINKKKIIMHYFENDRNLTTIIHDAIVVDENEHIIFNSWFKYRKTKKGFINNIIKNRYLGCCMAFKKELLKYSFPIPKDIEMHDWWLGLCSEKYGKTKLINEPLILYRRHTNNSSKLYHYGLKKMINNRLKLLYRIFHKK